MIKNQSYDLIINGYDWGPGNDKIIIHSNNFFSQAEIKVSDFIVKTETYCYNWDLNKPSLNLKTGKRKIKNAYICDKDGNKIDNKSDLIALELEVHPDDPFSNPFLYGSDMMNHWQNKYELNIINNFLDINTSLLNEKRCISADEFKINNSTCNNVNLSYAIWYPKTSSKKIPLIIWLHGMGEGGNDPYIALYGNKVVNLTNEKIQKCFKDTGAIILVPQVNGFWMQTKLGKNGLDEWISEESELTKSIYTDSLFMLINKVIESNPIIDRKRIYIGGCSNGGYMSINMMLEYPDFFAASFPICMAYPDSRISENKLKILSKQHIWFTQSLDDKTVDPQKYTIPLVKRLKKLNADDIHLSLWENVIDTTGKVKKDNLPYLYNGHFSWIYVLNNECIEDNISIFQWLSGIKK